MSGAVSVNWIMVSVVTAILNTRTITAREPQRCNVAVTENNIESICQGSTNDITRVQQQYHYWDRPKLKRMKAGFDTEFIRDVYYPMDALDNLFQKIEISKSLHLPKECYRNLTAEFCEKVAGVVTQVLRIGTQGLLHGQAYSDPFIVQNYVFFLTYDVTSLQAFFNFKAQKNTITPYYNKRVLFLFLFPGLLMLISFNIWCLLSLLKNHNSSAFVIHLAVQTVDLGLCVSFICFAFPIELLIYRGYTCSNINADWLQIMATLGLVEHSIRVEETLLFINYILLTLIVVDRSVAITHPVYYKSHFNKSKAVKAVTASIVTGTMAALTLYLNYHNLYDYLPNKYILLLILLTRISLLTVHVLLDVLQLLLTLLIVIKLLRRRKQITNAQTDRTSKYILLFFFTVYNILASFPPMLNIYYEALWELILMKYCNTCPVLFFNYAPYVALIQYVCVALIPDSGTNGFILHLFFVPTYRNRAIKLLCLKKIIVFVSNALRIHVASNSRTGAATNPVQHTNAFEPSNRLHGFVQLVNERRNFLNTKNNRLHFNAAPSVSAFPIAGNIGCQGAHVVRHKISDIEIICVESAPSSSNT